MNITGRDTPAAASTARYVGQDRREAGRIGSDRPGLFFYVVGGALPLAWTLLARPGPRATASLLQGPAASTILVSVAATLGCVAGCLALLRGRLTGEAPAQLAGAGMVVLALFAVALPELGSILGATIPGGNFVWVRLASVAIAAVLLLRAVTVQDVDPRVRPGRLFAAATTVLLAAILGGRLLPPVLTTVDADLRSVVALGVTAGWVLLAAGYLLRGIRTQRSLLNWWALVWLAYGMATGASVVGSAAEVLSLADALLLSIVHFIALVAVVRDIQRIYADQSRTLFETTVKGLVDQTRLDAERALQEERAHESRNALTAIDGATQTLERFRDALDPRARESLCRAVAGEIARLRALIDREPARHPIDFRLGAVVEQQVTLARTQGLTVLCDVPDDLSVYARPADIAEALQNLLINARRHAGGSAVLVRAAAEGHRVYLRVQDRGPGVAKEQRTTLFDRGRTGRPEGPGQGLGLYVSKRLIQEQGGDLWLEDRPGAGASFVVSLPAAAAPRRGDLPAGEDHAASR